MDSFASLTYFPMDPATIEWFPFLDTPWIFNILVYTCCWVWKGLYGIPLLGAAFYVFYKIQVWRDAAADQRQHQAQAAEVDTAGPTNSQTFLEDDQDLLHYAAVIVEDEQKTGRRRSKQDDIEDWIHGVNELKRGIRRKS